MENRLSFKLQSTAESFIEVYSNNLGKHPTPKQAYEATEEDHERRTGFRHYSEYQAFRTVLSRHRGKRRRN